MKALDTLDQITADLVRATRASAISMRQLMDANLQPVAYSVEGAVVASEHIRRALNILDAPIISIGAVERSDGSKELGQEQLSWKLQKSKKGISQEIRRQENKLLLAESFLDDARSFVDGFDAAAKDALLLLERFGIESQGTISRIWLDFLESEPMQLLLYTTGFFAREKPFEELREEAKKVSEGFAALLALVIETGQQLQALNSQVASTSLDQHSEFKIQQNSRLIKLIYLCRIYAIVNDFSDTVLWLKMYGQERPFAETLHALAVAGNPLFKECIKNLAELPRVRLAADTVWDTLNIDVSRSKNQPKKPSH
jgi:hypothetical protein